MLRDGAGEVVVSEPEQRLPQRRRGERGRFIEIEFGSLIRARRGRSLMLRSDTPPKRCAIYARMLGSVAAAR
jgi:hypothetical protein